MPYSEKFIENAALIINFIVSIGLVFSLVGGIGLWWAGNEKERIAADKERVANTEIARLNAQAKVLEVKNKAVVKKFAARTVSLTERDILISSLKLSQNKFVWIRYGNYGEARRYASELADVFRAANWQVKSEKMSPGLIDIGLVVTKARGISTSNVADAFNKAQIDFEIDDESMEDVATVRVGINAVVLDNKLE